MIAKVENINLLFSMAYIPSGNRCKIGNSGIVLPKKPGVIDDAKQRAHNTLK
jgi:hypothetical protein